MNTTQPPTFTRGTPDTALFALDTSATGLAPAGYDAADRSADELDRHPRLVSLPGWAARRRGGLPPRLPAGLRLRGAAGRALHLAGESQRPATIVALLHHRRRGRR